jgi:hypothetical protein
MLSRSPLWRALAPAALTALLLAPSCAPGFDPPSKINTLRILAVTVDKPYALPGDQVTFRMTFADGFDTGPRGVMIVWLGGCFDPEGDQYFLCLQQLAEVLAPLASGGAPPPDLAKIDIAEPNDSGVPDNHEFTITLPEDIVSRRTPPPTGPHYGIAYVFFAACAGTIAPGPLTAPGGGQVPDFPLQCLDADGNKLGNESFVIGYTQVYAFADGRMNANPPVVDLVMDDASLSEDPAAATVAEACPVSEEDRRVQSCGGNPADDCRKYSLRAIVNDIAEIDPDAVDPDGNVLREVVWVSYYVDGGEVTPGLALISDAVEGYQEDHDTEWTPPAEPGVYNVWAVVRDQRGGSTVLRRFVEVR